MLKSLNFALTTHALHLFMNVKSKIPEENGQWWKQLGRGFLVTGEICDELGTTSQSK